MNINNFTYNEISFMAFGEAIAVKTEIDKILAENKRLNEAVEELSNALVGVKKGE